MKNKARENQGQESSEDNAFVQNDLRRCLGVFSLEKEVWGSNFCEVFHGMEEGLDRLVMKPGAEMGLVCGRYTLAQCRGRASYSRGCGACSCEDTPSSPVAGVLER